MSTFARVIVGVADQQADRDAIALGRALGDDVMVVNAVAAGASVSLASPAATLQALAAERHADLIVVGPSHR